MNDNLPPDEFDDLPEPPKLRSLRIMVTTLTATMIIGLLTIIILIVIKIMAPPAPRLSLPETIDLPYGEEAQAYTQGLDWIGVVTLDDEGNERIHILNVDGTPRQVIELNP